MAAQATGHVRLVQRARGAQWYVKYRLPNGRQVQHRLGPAWTERSRPPAGYFTKRTAEAELRRILTDAERGTLAGIDRSGKTFGDACAEWLRYGEHDKQLAASTLGDYRNVVNGYLLPEFGVATAIEKITTERIEGYRDRLLEERHLSRRSVQKVLVLLHGVLKRAKRRKWIATNPAEDVERVRVKRSGDFNVLTPAEVAALARVADDDAALFTVAAFTGLRLGELRALRWADVDFAKRAILVRRNLPSHGEESTPKSGKVRSVPLIDQAAVALDELSRREHFTGPDDRVFADALGGAFDDGPLRDRFYAALLKAGLGHKRYSVLPSKDDPKGTVKDDPIVFHDLRHTFGTLGAAIWPLHDLQGYMGHADIQTTMIYVHHVPKVTAADELSRAVAAAMSGEPVQVERQPSASKLAK